MKRISSLLLLLILFPALLSGQDNPSSSDRFINTLLPGWYQIQDGRTLEGALYMSGLPMLIGGQLLAVLWAEELNADVEFFKEVDGRHYFMYSESFRSGGNDLLFFAANAATLWGTLLYSYSQYDVAVRESSGVAESHTQLGLGEILLAPWQPKNVFNPQVLPVLVLTNLVPLYSIVMDGEAEAFFTRETVPFLGRQVSPALAFGGALAGSLFLVSANAGWEEIVFRGPVLQRRGLTASSLQFGLVHAPNALGTNVAVEDTAGQVLFATAFGFYAGYLTEANGYDFRRAMALHFWHNVVAFLADYISNPDESLMFRIELNLRR